MKLTHHDDGSWSLTGMTDEQVHDLAMGLSNSVARQVALSNGQGAWQGFDERDRAYFARQWQRTEHVRSWLDKATRWGEGLRRRSSSTYVPEQVAS
jgi:hypothetical protein